MQAAMPVDLVMSNYLNGDETSWLIEFAWLLRNEGPKMADLIEDIAKNGVQEPVSLGDDGRVWDGHHRILACKILGLRLVPVRFEGDQ